MFLNIKKATPAPCVVARVAVYYFSLIVCLDLRYASSTKEIRIAATKGKKIIVVHAFKVHRKSVKRVV